MRTSTVSRTCRAGPNPPPLTKGTQATSRCSGQPLPMVTLCTRRKETSCLALARGVYPTTAPSSDTVRCVASGRGCTRSASGICNTSQGPQNDDESPTATRAAQHATGWREARGPYHAAFMQDGEDLQGLRGGVVVLFTHHLTGAREVVEQAARVAVRSVHRAQEAPRLGQQLARRGGAQLREACAAMDGPEVRQEAVVVDLLRHHRVAALLLQVQSRLGHQIACPATASRNRRRQRRARRASA
eukprot:scaffold7820_cov363-Prasinococcus_capsulatus_cf.AAC.4